MCRQVFSPPLRGGVSATSIKYREASFMERTGWCFGTYSPPRLRELRMLCAFLLIAQPPLLEEEGKNSDAGSCNDTSNHILSCGRAACAVGRAHREPARRITNSVYRRHEVRRAQLYPLHGCVW